MKTQGKITNTAKYLATLGLTGLAGQNFILSKFKYLLQLLQVNLRMKVMFCKQLKENNPFLGKGFI